MRSPERAGTSRRPHHDDAEGASDDGNHDLVLLWRAGSGGRPRSPTGWSCASRSSSRTSARGVPRAGRARAAPPGWGRVHPLVALSDREQGAERLRGAWFGVAGDPLVERVGRGPRRARRAGRRRGPHDLPRGGRRGVEPPGGADGGQVRRLAESVDVPLEAYLDLAVGALGERRRLGPGDRADGTGRPGRLGDGAAAPRRPARRPSARPTGSSPSTPARLVEPDA
jgi:hypothetical protein